MIRACNIIPRNVWSSSSLPFTSDFITCHETRNDCKIFCWLVSLCIFDIKRRDACNNQIDISSVLEIIFDIDVLDMTLSIREFCMRGMIIFGI